MERGYAIDFLQVLCGPSHPPTATIRLKKDGCTLGTEACVGKGPFDAVWKVIVKVTDTDLKQFGPAIEQMGPPESPCFEVRAELKNGSGERFEGRAMDSDVVTAYANATITAMNRASDSNLQ